MSPKCKMLHIAPRVGDRRKLSLAVVMTAHIGRPSTKVSAALQTVRPDFRCMCKLLEILNLGCAGRSGFLDKRLWLPQPSAAWSSDALPPRCKLTGLKETLPFRHNMGWTRPSDVAARRGPRSIVRALRPTLL